MSGFPEPNADWHSVRAGGLNRDKSRRDYRALADTTRIFPATGKRDFTTHGEKLPEPL